jgi:hypothetical protein
MTVRVKAHSQQFPARLRLRFPALRGARLACAQLAASLRQVAGVRSVEASAAAGSVLVIYQVEAEAEHAFLARLRTSIAHHGLSGDAPHAATQGAGAPVPSALDGVAGKFVGAVVDKLVERSALALVAALL